MFTVDLDGMSLTILAFNGILLVLFLFVGARMKQRSEERDIALRHLQNDFAAMCAAAVGLGDRLDRLDEKIRIVAERQDQLDMREPMLRSYKQAKNLLTNGADIDDIVSDCGMSHGEAELISILHRLERQTKEPLAKRA
jgi:hypothetical protein